MEHSMNDQHSTTAKAEMRLKRVSKHEDLRSTQTSIPLIGNYTLIFQPKTVHKDQSLNEWEHLELNEDGNADLRSVNSVALNGPYLATKETIKMEERIGGDPVMLRVQKKTTEEKQMKKGIFEDLSKDGVKDVVVL